jgi:hypothetical protein
MPVPPRRLLGSEKLLAAALLQPNAVQVEDLARTAQLIHHPPGDVRVVTASASKKEYGANAHR